MIVPLRPDDLNSVWLVAESHYTNRMLRQHLETFPYLGWMVQENGDYIVGSYWKDRPAIGLIMESSPSTQRANLATRLLDSYAGTGSELVVLSEREVTHSLRLYVDMGFISIQEVVCYEKPDILVPPVERRLVVRKLEDSDLAALVELEEAAFPWLWWETPVTFRQIGQKSDTRVLLAYLDGDLIGYLVLAVRATWGHINRIGVHPARQGQGFGRELMAVAITDMARLGARTVGLNTQSDNLRSQRLYESFGFERTGESFRIYGKWMDGRA